MKPVEYDWDVSESKGADAIERLSGKAEPDVVTVPNEWIADQLVVRDLTPSEHKALDAALRKSVKVVAHPAAPAPDVERCERETGVCVQVHSAERLGPCTPKNCRYTVAPAPDDARDAARYRWLRDTPWYSYPGLDQIISQHRNALWDAAIDAAMKEKP